MRLLLDSHVLIWLIEGSPRISASASDAITAPDNEVFVSSATVWEIAIKQAKSKLPGDIGVSLARFPDYRFQVLGIQMEHILATRALQLHHGDPFDRLLIAQAKIEDLTIVTHDDMFRPYGVPILWT